MTEAASREMEATEPTEQEKVGPIQYVYTTNLPELFGALDISIVATTYQAQFVMALSAIGSKMSMTLRHFERPTGLAIKGRHMAMCSRNQLWLFRATGTLRDLEGSTLPYDRCYAPAHAWVTGDISGHELAWAADELLVVNTRFSCLCKPSDDWSFIPVWKPPFISAIVPEDRCHLNGVAADGNGPRFLTALGATDTAQGWRQDKAHGGVILRYPDGEVVARGLAMPHSPRLHQGRLYVLDSGMGELQVVDPSSGRRDTVVRLDGYLRGLAFHDRYAFIGLCKMREKREFGGLPIEAIRDRLRCALQVVDLATGTRVGHVEFTGGVEELFAVEVVPGVRQLHIIGMKEPTIDGLFVVPDVVVPDPGR